MKAAVLYQTGQPLVIEDIQIDKPSAREVLIRTVACGVCHSDLHVADAAFPARLPCVLGHEAAGVVEAVGSEVRGIKPGDHVVTCAPAYCGCCEDCLSGHPTLCASNIGERARGEAPRLTPGTGKPGKLFQFGGLNGFAETMLVHERNCVVIDKRMPLDKAAVIGCAVVTGVGSVINTARVAPGSTVAVIGCGGVGLMAVNGAAIAGAGRIIAIDRVPAKLELARRMGATDVLDANDTDIVQAVTEMTRGGVHYSFEAIGLKSTTEQAFRMLRRGGTATIIGVAKLGTVFEIGAMDLLMERKLQGSYFGSNRPTIDMPRYVDLYLRGRLHLDQLVSKRVPLEAINEAFAELRTGQTARSVIEFG